jgi:hypothetical protein
MGGHAATRTPCTTMRYHPYHSHTHVTCTTVPKTSKTIPPFHNGRTLEMYHCTSSSTMSHKYTSNTYHSLTTHPHVGGTISVPITQPAVSERYVPTVTILSPIPLSHYLNQLYSLPKRQIRTPTKYLDYVPSETIVDQLLQLDD